MNKYSVPYVTLFRSQYASRQHIIGLYGTPADRQAVLRLAWYRPIRPIRFEIRFEREKKRFAGPYSICPAFVSTFGQNLLSKFPREPPSREPCLE